MVRHDPNGDQRPGRIGRTFLKLALENRALEVVAANDISDPNSLTYLIKYDSVYGKYHGSVKVEHPPVLH
jgi:glyceraldehyde 3-phosphate dehydrogenase